MTGEEAINKLNWALDNNMIEDVQSAYDYIMAIDMAIKALKAIDEIEKLCDNPDYMTDDPENDSGSWEVIPVNDVMEIIEQVAEVEK